MKKNKAIFFLLFVFLLLVGILYKMIDGPEYRKEESERTLNSMSTDSINKNKKNEFQKITLGQKNNPDSSLSKDSIIVDLKMTKQNEFSWNQYFANDSLRLIFKATYKKRGTENIDTVALEYNVTGKSSFTFKPGDARFDAVKTNIEIIIFDKEQKKIKGKDKIRVLTIC
jgi:hypothetical protein